jgi:hypothetical protein
MKSSFQRLIPLFSLFCKCQFRRLDSIQFLCSQAHIPAGRPPGTRLFTSLLTRLLFYELSLSFILRPTVSRPICLGIKHPSGAYDQILIIVRQLRVCWFGAPSLTRGRICRLQLLLVLASAVFLGSESLGTRDHILLSQIWDFPFRRLLLLAGSRWRYSTPPPHGFYVHCSMSKSKSHCDWRSVSL